MRKEQIEPTEAAIRALAGAGDLDAAATAALRLYGPEVFGFLLALHHGDEDAASDVFATFGERLWRGLRGFEWASSLRTWAYTVARHASVSHHRAAARRLRRDVPLAACPAVLEAAARVRTETLSWLRTERRTEIAEIRRSLSPDDQALLVLRVDRGMAWPDLARVLLDEVAPSPDLIEREAARLRKRFQLVKQKIAALARRRGLLPQRGD
jgi:RNA polymerase sigma-70 factor (ECF subfamily)